MLVLSKSSVGLWYYCWCMRHPGIIRSPLQLFLLCSVQAPDPHQEWASVALSKLVSLDLSHTDVSNHSFLRGAFDEPQLLGSLSLAGTRVTTTGVRFLMSAPALSRLDVSNTRACRRKVDAMSRGGGPRPPVGDWGRCPHGRMDALLSAWPRPRPGVRGGAARMTDTHSPARRPARRSA